jgi:hypothetical protein
MLFILFNLNFIKQNIIQIILIIKEEEDLKKF